MFTHDVSEAEYIANFRKEYDRIFELSLLTIAVIYIACSTFATFLVF